MPELFDCVVLAAFVVTILVFSYVTFITSRVLWRFIFRRSQNSVQIVPILTTLVVSWWLCAITSVLLAVYNVAFWRPEPIYDRTLLFSFFLPVTVALNCVHISQFFITLERIIIMKSANPNYNQKVLLALCIITNVVISLFIAILFIIYFNPDNIYSPACMPILCMIDMKVYLISYHVASAILLATLIASLYFLLLVRKTTINAVTSGKQAAKMQNMIKFTICVDVCLDILPQMITVVLFMTDSPLGPYFGTLQRVLFTFCGICVNYRFYKVFVVNGSSVAMMSSSNLKTQSKLFVLPQNKSTVVPALH